MEKTISHNVYLKEIETDLANVKAQLILNEENTSNVYKNAVITEKSSELIKRDAKKYLDRTINYFNDLTDLNEKISEVKLLTDKAKNMLGVASTDEQNATKDVATAARSIEVAMEYITILSSDAAAINSKAASEDDGTRLSKMAQESYAKGLEAAESAEKATLSSLEASILASSSNAKFINDLITQFVSNIGNLNSAISTTFQNAKLNVDASRSKFQEASETSNTSESAMASADLNYLSARTANSEDTIKLGLAEAIKIVKDTDKKTDTSKKQ